VTDEQWRRTSVAAISARNSHVGETYDAEIQRLKMSASTARQSPIRSVVRLGSRSSVAYAALAEFTHSYILAETLAAESNTTPGRAIAAIAFLPSLRSAVTSYVC